MIQPKNNPYALLQPSFLNLFAIIIITFLIMIISVGMIDMVVDKYIENKRNTFLFNSVLQSIFAFIFPSCLAAFLCIKKPGSYLGINIKIFGRQFLGVLILYFISLPFFNALIEWNSNLHLPDFMSGLENMFRNWEDSAAATTSIILNDSSWFGLISGILVVGIITGVSEEMFFRAGIQRAIMQSSVSPHIAIWLTAIIFSAIHFQFFGFIPRLLLGALFGYFYYYSGSIWISSFAHAFNNSMAVIIAWLISRGYVGNEIETIGSNGIVDFWISLSSMVFTSIFIVFYFSKFELGEKLKKFSING